MHLPVCVKNGEDIAFMCLGQSIFDWLELTGGNWIERMGTFVQI